MARAEKKMETVTRMVEVEKEEEVVQLTLSKEEAKALHMLLRKVGGCPDTSLRKYTEAIESSLEPVVPFVPIDKSDRYFKLGQRAEIYFANGQMF
jgi:hypothetical protein